MIGFMEKGSFFSRKAHTTKAALETVKLQYKEDIYLIMAAFTKVKFKVVRRMAKALTLTPSKIISIQACGRKINLMEKESRNSEMGPTMKEIFKKVLNRDMGIMSANQEFMKVSFLKAISMEREHSVILMGARIKGNGLTDFLLGMEYLLGLMETGIREST